MPSFDSDHFRLDYTGAFPDQLKLIKTVSVFPVEVTAVGCLNPRTNSWSYCIGAKDTIIGGRITYDHKNSTVQYRKALPLPVFGGLTRPVLSAEWQLGSEWRRAPRLQLGLAVADDASSVIDDGATLTNDGNVAFRKKVFLSRRSRWGMEVNGDMQFKLAHSLSGGGPAAGNSLHFQLSAKELNLVFRL